MLTSDAHHARELERVRYAALNAERAWVAARARRQHLARRAARRVGAPRVRQSGMPNQTFGRETTIDELLEGADLSGRRILVTGGSAGLGAETVRALAAHGAHVIMPVRDLAKGERAAAAAREAARLGGTVELCELELESLASVRACADRLVAAGAPLHVLIANAGVMACPQGKTRDGFETQFGTNHLGHFVLVNRLVPLLLRGAPSRIVVLSSAGHRFSDVDLEDPGFERTPYDPWIAYGRAKTANVLFAVGLDRRLRERGVRAAAVHPGGIRTELGRHLNQEAMAALVKRMSTRARLSSSRSRRAPPPRSGPGFVADAAEVGGKYCEDCGVAKLTTDSNASGGVRGYALDAARAEALWARSEELVRERFALELESSRASPHAKREAMKRLSSRHPRSFSPRGSPWSRSSRSWARAGRPCW